MSTAGKAITIGLIILLGGIGLFLWKGKFGGQHSAGITKLSKEDMELIFKDASPAILKKLADDPEMKNKQIEQLKQFLAIAQEARDKGFADTPEAKKAFEEAEITVTAINYDKEKNKDKENLPPLASITKEEVDAFMQKPENSSVFDSWVNDQLAEAKKDKRIPDDFKPAPEQIDQAKEKYAKVRIAYADAKAHWNDLSPELKHKIELAIKLQQAQYLASKYSMDVLAKEAEVTDAEVDKYMTDHPEETKILTEKKTKAEEVLKRAQSGEDFGKLAEEFSDDPGSKKNGGLYKDQSQGAMLPEFESAALALEPGKIAGNLVETKYGYHIIKLEKKGTKKDKDGKETPTYDVRHILFSTMPENKDPNNPFAQPLPLRDKIKNDLETAKQKKLIDEITARHPIEIATDFQIVVPATTPEPPAPAGEPQMKGPDGKPMQLSPEQREQIEKQIREMQNKQNAAPKAAGNDAK